MGLSDLIQDQDVKNNIKADCASLIDEQVAGKGGVSGLALKATYKVIKGGLGPTYIPDTIERLLPDVLSSLDSIWQEGVESGDPVAHLSNNNDRTADILLGITDKRIEQSSNGIVKGAYGKLRSSVKGDIAAAIPGLATIIAKYA